MLSDRVEQIVGKGENGVCQHFLLFTSYLLSAKLHNSVGSIQVVGEGCWFDSQLGQYSFQGLKIVIATGFIPL